MSNEQSEWPRILLIAHCSLLIAHSGARCHAHGVTRGRVGRGGTRPYRARRAIEPFLVPCILLGINAGSGRTRTTARPTSQGRVTGGLGYSLQALPTASLRLCFRAGSS